MAPARPVEPGFSPLDEELGLLPGSLSPQYQEHLSRLAVWMPIRAGGPDAGGADRSAGEFRHHASPDLHSWGRLRSRASCPGPLNESMRQQYAYLLKREERMQYPQYQQDGWPIGSGIVESGNKVVMQARLKGAGMHWAPVHVNPLLALRTAACNNRWEEATQQLRASRHAQRQLRREQQALQRLRQQLIGHTRSFSLRFDFI
jgi:hypothetical protein